MTINSFVNKNAKIKTKDQSYYDATIVAQNDAGIFINFDFEKIFCNSVSKNNTNENFESLFIPMENISYILIRKSISGKKVQEVYP